MSAAYADLQGYVAESRLADHRGCHLCGARIFANLTVTLLGTGTPRPVVERFGPSILVEAGKEKLLFDGGRGAT